MIKYKTGNIFLLDVEAIVNPVNCVGVMGKGLALQFKKFYPKNFEAYRAACYNDIILPGEMFIFNTDDEGFSYGHCNPNYIINFPTKRHWRDKSLLSDIKIGLNRLVDVIDELGIKSIAIPPLGSGLGGLAWSQVKRLIDGILSPLTDVEIIVLEPLGSEN